MNPPNPDDYRKENGNIDRAALRQAQKTYRTWLRTQGRTDVAQATGQSSAQAWSSAAADFGSELAGVASDYLGGSSTRPTGAPPDAPASSSGSDITTDPIAWAQENPIPALLGLGIATKLLRIW
jgi:hypothetical protein